MPQQPVENPTIITHYLEDDGPFPNHPRWPLLLYQQVLGKSSDIDPETVETLLHDNDWRGSWRNGVFGFHHYHSNAHECLFVYEGRATIQFGGSHGPQVEVDAGDIAVLPAGTVHKKIDGTPSFRVIGAYPGGKTHDMKYGREDERPEADQNIENVPLPDYDPLYGEAGPLFDYWN